MLTPSYNSIRFLLAAAFVFATTLNCAVAQSKPPDEYPRFEAIDLGTFGGPNAILSGFAQVISERGTVTSAADTSTITSCTSVLNYPGDCNALHAFSWRDGTLTDLGTLGGDNSFGFWINEHDDIAGVAENGIFNQAIGHPNQHAALWHNGTIADLGTFGGAQSFAVAINNRGQVAGAASTPVPDQFSLNFLLGGSPTNEETHAFLWDRGTLHDLGTLGGPDAFAFSINEAGQVAGISFTDYEPRNTIGGVPAAHGFVWDKGTMFDVGTFGGDLSIVFSLNNKGQAVGFADLAGDATSHAFLWERGNLRDLGTLGGTGSAARWISEAGDVTGQANLVGDQTFHAFSWRNGSMRDLGTVEGDSCSDATSVNSRRQIVGDSADCEFNAPHGFFVQGDGPIVDLESLIVRGPEIVALLFTPFISERGEIASLAALPNGDLRVVLLRPTNDRVGDGRDHHSSMSANERARAAAIIRRGQKGLHRFGDMPWRK